MMVQLLGGLSAASIAPRRRTARRSLKPVVHAWADFIVAELFFTLRLAFVVQSVVTVSSSLSQFFGCAISKGVATGGWVIGKISKESLHPDACSGGGGISLGCSNPPGALGIYSTM